MAFRMAFPGDWKTRNKKQGVTALGPNKDAVLQLTLVEESEPRAAAQEFLAQEGIQAGRVQMGHVNGLTAASATFESSLQGSNITGRVVFVRHKKQTFQLLGYTPRDRWSSYSSLIESSLRSFAPLNESPASTAAMPSPV